MFDENVFVVKTNVKCWNCHCSESWMMIVCESNINSFLIIFIFFKLIIFIIIIFFCFFHYRVCVCFYNHLKLCLFWSFYKLFSDVNIFHDINRKYKNFYDKSRSKRLTAWFRDNEFNFWSLNATTRFLKWLLKFEKMMRAHW